MLKAAAVVQLLFILLIVGFSTYALFRGRFDLALGLLPFLMVYYIFVTVRNRRKASVPAEKERGPDSGRV
jgi:hypothetical protein